MIFLTVFLCSCNTEQSEFYPIAKKYRSLYGYITSFTVNNGYDEDDEKQLSELLDRVESVMTATGDARQRLDVENKLDEYKNEDNVAEVKDFNIKIESADTSGNSGYIWVVYSGKWFDEKGFVIKNREDELAYWKIKKENENWIVTETVNLP